MTAASNGYPAFPVSVSNRAVVSQPLPFLVLSKAEHTFVFPFDSLFMFCAKFSLRVGVS